MGIFYSAAIMIGLPRGEIDSSILEELLDEETLKVCPPYYDGDGEDVAIVGLSFAQTRDFTPKEFAWNDAEISRLKAQFLELTGLEAKVWLSPRGQ